MENKISSQELTGIFERKEKKYVLEFGQLKCFIDVIIKHITPDERGITKISSLYYDTPENTLISRSLEKPVYKEKLRIRAYGNVTSTSPVFVEIKKKFRGIVYKRRFACELLNAYSFMSNSCIDEEFKPLSLNKNNALENQNNSIEKAYFLEQRNYLEVLACKNRYSNLQPKMLIVTDRIAFYSNDESDIRFTIDLNPTYDDVNLYLESNLVHKPLLEDDKCILEIKSAKALPMWLVEAMSEMQIRPQSFSKYGEAFKKSRQDSIKCSVSKLTPKHAKFKEAAYV